MSHRPASVIAEQIAHFEAGMPKNYSPPPDDFAAKLQWESWQNHLTELREELEAAKQREAA